MSFGSIAFVVFGSVLLLLSGVVESAAPWSFKTPNNWGVNYMNCNGVLQSPISITTREVSTGLNSFLRFNLPLDMYSASGGAARVAYERLSTDNTDAFVYLNATMLGVTMFSELFGTLYNLRRVMVFSPALHVVDGVRAEAEIVFDFFPMDLEPTTGDVMLSYLVKDTGKGGASNPDILAYLNGDSVVPILGTSSQNILTRGTVSYPGSLPYPPCTQNVYWGVMTTVLQAPSYQIDALVQQSLSLTKLKYNEADASAAESTTTRPVLSRPTVPPLDRNIIGRRMVARPEL